MSKKHAWIDEFLDSTEKAFGFMDLETLQPCSWRHFQPLISQEWVDWFGRIVEASEGKNFRDLASALPPDLCKEHMFFTLEDLKVAQVPKEKRLQFAEFFYELLACQMHGELFGLKGTNCLHSKEQVDELLSREFVHGTQDAARQLGRLYNSAYNLGAALYLDFYMGKAIENYGPYAIGPNKILVIKVMRFLKPTEVWPKASACASELVWYAVYENVEFSCDLIACHTQYKGDPVAGLAEWRLERDGEEVTDLREIGEITENLSREGKRQWTELLALPEQALLGKAVWIRCFMFKALCEKLGLDWRPTKELLAAITEKTLAEGWGTWKPPAGAKAREYWRKILDPRVDFYP